MMGYDLRFPEYCKTNNGLQKWEEYLLNLGGHQHKCGQFADAERGKISLRKQNISTLMIKAISGLIA